MYAKKVDRALHSGNRKNSKQVDKAKVPSLLVFLPQFTVAVIDWRFAGGRWYLKQIKTHKRKYRSRQEDRHDLQGNSSSEVYQVLALLVVWPVFQEDNLIARLALQTVSNHQFIHNQVSWLNYSTLGPAIPPKTTITSKNNKRKSDLAVTPLREEFAMSTDMVIKPPDPSPEFNYCGLPDDIRTKYSEKRKISNLYGTLHIYNRKLNGFCKGLCLFVCLSVTTKRKQANYAGRKFCCWEKNIVNFGCSLGPGFRGKKATGSLFFTMKRSSR